MVFPFDLRIYAWRQSYRFNLMPLEHFGVCFQGHWCAQQWPQEWGQTELFSDLTFLELFPILIADWLWWGRDG